MIDSQGAAPKELLRNDNNRTSRYFQDGAEGGQPLIFPNAAQPAQCPRSCAKRQDFPSEPVCMYSLADSTNSGDLNLAAPTKGMQVKY